MGVADLIPQKIGKWQRTGAPKTYDRETIFDYIDGAGEVYRLYDFREVTILEFRQAKSPPVVVEIFDMGRAGDAYGIFTFYHEGQEVDVGEDAYLRSGLLCFWQDKYFTCVSTDPEAGTAEATIREIARGITAVLPREGCPPGWLDYFPEADQRPQSTRYFHNHASLNYHLYLSDRNILKLDDQTECALAHYRKGEEKFSQLWVCYPDSSAARAAYTGFMASRMPAGKLSGPGRDKQGRWTTATVHDRFVALVLGISSESEADSVKQAAEKILREVVK